MAAKTAVVAKEQIELPIPEVIEQAVGQEFDVNSFVANFDVLAGAAGGTKHLRTLVLSLALTGRLATRDSRDRPAKEAFEAVTSDRSWRIEERVAKPKYDMKIEALVGVTPIPDGWIECRLDDCAQLINGRAYAQHELLDAGTPVIRIQNLNGGSDWYYSDLTLPERQYCDKGDLLFAWSASFGPYIWDGPRAIYHYHTWKLNLSDALDKRFFYFSLMRITDVVREQSHGLAMLHMTKAQMERWPIMLPPLAEQKRIVARVDQLIALIDDLESKQTRKRHVGARFTKASLEALTTAQGPAEFQSAWQRVMANWETVLDRPEKVGEVRRAVLELALSGRFGGTRSSHGHAEEEFGLPSSWQVLRVEELASAEPRSIQSGPFGSNLLHSEFQDSGKLVIGIDNVGDGEFHLGRQHRISESKFAELEKYRARPLDVLITVMATVGRCCIVPEDVEPAIITKHVYRITANKKLVRPDYLLMALRGSTLVREEVEGQTRGSTRPGINGEVIKGIPIPLPPLVEQQRIVEKVDQLMKLCDQLEQALRRAEERAGRWVEAVVRVTQ